MLELDEAVYSPEVVQKALYWLSDRAVGIVQRGAHGKLSVSLRPLDAGADVEALASEFLVHLTDFGVRRQIDLETRGIRELIFTKALAASGAFEDQVPGDDRDPVEQSVTDPGVE